MASWWGGGGGHQSMSRLVTELKMGFEVFVTYSSKNLGFLFRQIWVRLYLAKNHRNCYVKTRGEVESWYICILRVVTHCEERGSWSGIIINKVSPVTMLIIQLTTNLKRSCSTGFYS